ncbi:hypothetical protein CCMA1212_005753 [Trichoderma ghanense]|uniref:Uncharacterized protein n=1 Tax=Trichoderma ghanense TaxID=65468 RepID=A0ABY2H2F7_9HYPO
MILEALPCAPCPAQWMHRETPFLMRKCVVPRHACVHLASPAGSGRTLAPCHGRSPNKSTELEVSVACAVRTANPP